MTKTLIATKCKDGWVVEIRRTEIVTTETDVYSIARYEGINISERLSTSDRIYGK